MSTNVNWQKTEQGLYKKYRFEDFRVAFDFMTRVAEVAEANQHHPTWKNEWNTVEIWLLTHDAGGTITEKDRHMAEEIDTLETV